MTFIPIIMPPLNNSGGNISLFGSMVIMILILYLIAFIFGVAEGSFESYYRNDPFPNIASIVFFTYPLGWVLGVVLFTQWWRK